MSKRKLFSDIHPICYAISVYKEILIRHMKNMISREKIARKQGSLLPHIVSENSSNLIKKGAGIDPILQENKAKNIMIASKNISTLIIHPGEVFSFWRLVGKITKRKGYKDGRILIKNKLTGGIGGGLCNLANSINLLILHSPLDVIERHVHSDALAPDPDGNRVPFSAGVSVWYNNIDYKFKNNTHQCFQLEIWREGDELKTRLRCESELLHIYKLHEENHHFKEECGKFYRTSLIYKLTVDKRTNQILNKNLVLNNHSEVLYDYNLIPQHQIKRSS